MYKIALIFEILIMLVLSVLTILHYFKLKNMCEVEKIELSWLAVFAVFLASLETISFIILAILAFLKILMLSHVYYVLVIVQGILFVLILFTICHNNYLILLNNKLREKRESELTERINKLAWRTHKLESKHAQDDNKNVKNDFEDDDLTT